MDASITFFGPLGGTFLIGLAALVLLLWYSTRHHSYWKGKGIPYAQPYPLVGSMLQNFILPTHESEQMKYKKYGPIYGHYQGSRPAISVAEPHLLRDILVRDFQFFPNRSTLVTYNDMADNMILNLEGDDWKRVRSIITPTFSTGKLKRMIGIFKECSSTLIQNFKNAAKQRSPIIVKRIYGAMAMDVIASSAFSTKIDSHNDPDNKFVQMSKKTVGNSFSWRMVIILLAPKLMTLFRITLFHPDSMQFFKEVTIQIINERKRLNQTKNDFLQLLINTAGEVSAEESKPEQEDDLLNNYGQAAEQKVFSNSITKNLSMDEMVAQCVSFFIAGYNTIAVTLSFTSYQLALNPDVQEKARQEIKDCLQASKGELTYDAIQSMKYLDNILSETLRLNPPATVTGRTAESDYELGNTGIKIEKGMMVTIPIYAIHMDDKYYTDPEKFDPDRFTPENRSKRDPYVYLPFGAGPRNCIGMRFALLELKVCLIHVLSHFNIKTCHKTDIPLKFHSGVPLMQSHDIYLEMEPRNDSTLK